MAMHRVFTNLSANGKSGVLTVTDSAKSVVIVASGTFGSGTLGIEISPDDGTTWVPVEGASNTLTKAGIVDTFVVPQMCQVRLDFSGATNPTLQAWCNLTIPPPS